MTPQELQRSGRIRQGPSSSFSLPATPEIIELDEEKEEMAETSGQIPYDPWVNDWIKKFSVALLRGFEPELSADALINYVVAAAKGPLIATKVADQVG